MEGDEAKVRPSCHGIRTWDLTCVSMSKTAERSLFYSSVTMNVHWSGWGKKKTFVIKAQKITRLGFLVSPFVTGDGQQKGLLLFSEITDVFPQRIFMTYLTFLRGELKDEEILLRWKSLVCNLDVLCALPNLRNPGWCEACMGFHPSHQFLDQ